MELAGGILSGGGTIAGEVFTNMKEFSGRHEDVYHVQQAILSKLYEAHSDARQKGLISERDNEQYHRLRERARSIGSVYFDSISKYKLVSSLSISQKSEAKEKVRICKGQYCKAVDDLKYHLEESITTGPLDAASLDVEVNSNSGIQSWCIDVDAQINEKPASPKESFNSHPVAAAQPRLHSLSQTHAVSTIHHPQQVAQQAHAAWPIPHIPVTSPPQYRPFRTPCYCMAPAPHNHAHSHQASGSSYPGMAHPVSYNDPPPYAYAPPPLHQTIWMRPEYQPVYQPPPPPPIQPVAPPAMRSEPLGDSANPRGVSTTMRTVRSSGNLLARRQTDPGYLGVRKDAERRQPDTNMQRVTHHAAVGSPSSRRSL